MKKIFFSFLVFLIFLNNLFANQLNKKLTLIPQIENYLVKIVNSDKCIHKKDLYYCKDVNVNKEDFNASSLELNLEVKKDIMNIIDLKIINFKSKYFTSSLLKIDTLNNKKNFYLKDFKSKYASFDYLNGYLKKDKKFYLNIKGYDNNKETFTFDSFFQIMKNDFIINDFYIKLLLNIII